MWLMVSKTATLNGTLRATGGSATYGAGGAGGGIYVQCNTLAGSNAVLLANGGTGGNSGNFGAGGGGGRIAVWRLRDNSNTNTWLIQVLGTNGYAGTTTGTVGSVWFGQLPAPGSILILR